VLILISNIFAIRIPAPDSIEDIEAGDIYDD
jgi:hypothetical protein